jgi:hypothetical protein
MGVLFVAAVMLDVVHSESNIAPSASAEGLDGVTLGGAFCFIFVGIPHQDDLGDHNVRRFSQTRSV